MGTFEEDSEIRVSTVIKLWVSEGFLKPKSGKSLETVAKEYLDELVDRNLILVHKFGSIGKMKYCKIHDLFRDLCLREAQKEGFYHVVGQNCPQGTCSQRHVVIPKSTSLLRFVQAVRDKPHARSFIYDWGRVRAWPNLRLLRILKAHDEGSYLGTCSQGKWFELVNLRLLAVNSLRHPQLPSSINLLWSLQTLTVYQFGADVNAPVEIWNMPQLRHVRFWCSALHLPDPRSDSTVIMENLQTLKGVKNFKCDEMMVRRIPNIKKLGLIYHEDEGIETRDEDYCVHNIERLQKLESLICFFPSSDFSRKLTFPPSLKSLTLEMYRGRMEDILEKVSTLPLLQKLKLKYGDFTTGEWVTVEGQFLSLKFLSMDSCYNLEWWMMDSSHFPCLEHLHLISLDDLKEILAELGEIPTLKSVALEFCSGSAVKSAKRMVEDQEESQGDELSFKVAVRLSEKNEELLSLENPNFQVR